MDKNFRTITVSLRSEMAAEMCLSQLRQSQAVASASYAPDGLAATECGSVFENKVHLSIVCHAARVDDVMLIIKSHQYPRKPRDESEG